MDCGMEPLRAGSAAKGELPIQHGAGSSQQLLVNIEMLLLSCRFAVFLLDRQYTHDSEKVHLGMLTPRGVFQSANVEIIWGVPSRRAVWW